MKSMKKHALTQLSSCLQLVVTLFCTYFIFGIENATAQTSTLKIDELYYKIQDKRAYICPPPIGMPKYSGDFLIPNQVWHDGQAYSVTTEQKCFMASDVNNIVCGDSIAYIAQNVFQNSGIRTFKQNVKTNIFVDYGAFLNCKQLTAVDLRSPFQIAIGSICATPMSSNFRNCIALKEFVLNVDTENLFIDCADSLFYCDGYDVSTNPIYQNCVLYVPKAFINNYRAVEPFCHFKSIRALEDYGGIDAVTEDERVAVSTQYFDLTGRRLLEAPNKGIYAERIVYEDGTVAVCKLLR